MFIRIVMLWAFFCRRHRGGSKTPVGAHRRDREGNAVAAVGHCLCRVADSGLRISICRRGARTCGGVSEMAALYAFKVCKKNKTNPNPQQHAVRNIIDIRKHLREDRFGSDQSRGVHCAARHRHRRFSRNSGRPSRVRPRDTWSTILSPFVPADNAMLFLPTLIGLSVFLCVNYSLPALVSKRYAIIRNNKPGRRALFKRTRVIIGR